MSGRFAYKAYATMAGVKPKETKWSPDKYHDSFLDPSAEDMLEGQQDYELVAAARERNRRLRAEEEE